MAHIQFSATPNPNAGKFTADRKVLEGTGSKSFYSALQAAGDPIAEPIFALPGVASVFMVEDFVTVTKAVDADWDTLVPAVIEALERVLP